MKGLVLSLLVGLICFSTSFTQSISINEIENFCLVPSNTDFSKIYVKSFESFSKTDRLLSPNDTLNDHYLRATQFVTYAVNVQGNNYPLTGTNPIYYFLGEKFPIDKSGTIEGVLVSVSFKVVGTMDDTLVVSIYNSNQSNGLPEGAPIGNEIFFLENLDTNLTSPKFSYIDFKNPVNFSGSFVVMVLTRSVRVNNNGYVIFSNKHGDGANQERCCVLLYTQNGWVSSNLGSLIQFEGVPIDIDPMIIPIVTTGTSDVNDNISIGNIEIEKILVNQNQTNLSLALSSLNNYYDFTITVVDLNGNVILKNTFKNPEPGLKNQINIDVSKLISGSYFCIIKSGNDKIASKFSITR